MSEKAEKEMEKQMILDEAVEAAMIEWYGPDWKNRFFLLNPFEVIGAQSAMRRAIEAANIVTFRKMRGLDVQEPPR